MKAEEQKITTNTTSLLLLDLFQPWNEPHTGDPNRDGESQTCSNPPKIQGQLETAPPWLWAALPAVMCDIAEDGFLLQLDLGRAALSQEITWTEITSHGISFLCLLLWGVGACISKCIPVPPCCLIPGPLLALQRTKSWPNTWVKHRASPAVVQMCKDREPSGSVSF